MSKLLIQPVVVMMLLTMCVWCYMYYLRIGYSIKNKIHSQKLATPEKCNLLLPEAVNQPSNNLKNLFEMPVIFYVVSILFVISDKVDMPTVYLAWAYVMLRFVHSLIHCVLNHVLGRFVSYFMSSIVLWVMVCKFAYQVLTLT
ncbi:MAPEG family protein [Paraglaciecola aestuariivivens]